jgi:SAM-dependent methyltransferase
VCPYGCIGTFAFILPTVSRHRDYPTILSWMKEDSTVQFLDLGCGLGQNMRKLLVDEVPPAQLSGADISTHLITCGHEYFKDADRWQCKMYIGDMFDNTAPINAEASGRFDVIWAAMVYHLWDWEKQLKASIQTARLLKDKQGSLLFGWQLGATPAMEQNRTSLVTKRTGHVVMFRHDHDSFKKLWQEVSKETGIDFEVVTNVVYPDWRRYETEKDLGGSKPSVISFKVVRR